MEVSDWQARVRRTGGGRRLLFLSTYPPTRCGLATFTQALVDWVVRRRRHAEEVGVVRVLGADEPADDCDSLVLARVRTNRLGVDRTVSAIAQDFDLLVLQHEYGIFGPDDGIAVLDLLDGIDIPVVVTLHTVLATPSPRQRFILERLVDRSGVTVVMTEIARGRLIDAYRVDPAKLVVIPHGAHGFSAPVPIRRRHPQVITWGLLGPGKGVEWGILAMHRLRHLDPRPAYVIQGATHPHVLRREGERYRDRLHGLVSACGLSDMVQIMGGYLARERLGELVAAADVVLLPYDSSEQMTSGVLVEALAAGKPVVATAFPHAVELLSGGAGRIVPQRDSEAMAEALAALLADQSAMLSAKAAARRLAPDLLWSGVANRYCEVADRLLAGAVVAERWV